MNSLKTTLLLATLTGILMLLGQAVGGQSGLIIALAVAVVMNFSAYWFSDKIVLAMYRAKPLDEHDQTGVYQMVATLAQRAALPMPKVYIIDSQTPNAFATGRNPEHAAVAITTGLLRLLEQQEIMGVMAHEMAHVKHRDTLISAIAASIGGAIAMLANIAQWAMIFGASRSNSNQGNAAATLLMAILAPMVAGLIQMAVSRSREFAADKGGAMMCGDPLSLARALRKLEQANQNIPFQAAAEHPSTAHLFIVNPLKGFSVGRFFSTHPPTEERIRRLEAMAHS